MNDNHRSAPRSIDDYLKQLRAALEGADSALIQDALYDAEEYLRAEVAAHPDKSEADVLELIASTYGAPEEVAAAYRDTETKVKAALRTPPPRVATDPSGWRRFFGIFLDARAYSSLFYLLLSLVTGITYFTFVVTGLSLSVGLAVLIIGIPFFLAFVGIARAISLGEGRLLEAVTGERMPRRPVHPGPAGSLWTRIGQMLRDVRTWTTMLYLLMMLPLGILYFTLAVTGLSFGIPMAVAPVIWFGVRVGVFPHEFIDSGPDLGHWHLHTPHTWIGAMFMFAFGVLIITALMHAARGMARGHARLAKALLVEPGT